MATRKNGSTANAAALALVSAADITNLIPNEALFKAQPWFEKLNADEQGTVVQEGIALASVMTVNGASRLAIGEHLDKVRGVLEPHNIFTKFLAGFHFSKKTAYRYIKGYQNAKARLPEGVLKAAMARGLAIIGDTDQRPLGVYTDAVAKLPPPQSNDPVQINTWLDSVDKVRREGGRQTAGGAVATPQYISPGDPNELMKEVYKFVSVRYKRVPGNAKAKRNWVQGVVGMLLTDFGITTQQSFTPVAIPEDFRVSRGRPTKTINAAAA